MMTNRQLRALMEWVRAQARFEIAIESRYGEPEPHGTNAVRAKRAMYEAFGFAEGEDDKPVVLSFTAKHTNTGLATSDPEGHRQAIADADYDAKHDAIHALLLRNDPAVPMLETEEIMRLWPELKAIMEPGR